MDLRNICALLNQQLKLDLRQGISYFKIQNGGEYLWFDDSFLGTKLYFEITYFDPNFIVSVGPRNGEKTSSSHSSVEELIIACQRLIDDIPK